VLDVLPGYLLLAEALAAGRAPEAVNFGPAEAEEASVLDIIAGFEAAFGALLPWRLAEGAPPEAPRLALDAALAEAALGWRPRHDRAGCIAATAAWYAAWAAGADMRARCVADITEALA
jgi:CDP-glucose 4,6-dehydratase